MDDLLAMPWPTGGNGASLDRQTKQLRLDAVRVALENGHDLDIFQEFRHLIEGDGSHGTLTDANDLEKLVPMFANLLDRELKSKQYASLAIIFDGLSDKGDRVSVLFRGVRADESMLLEQHLLDMPLSSAPYNHTVLNHILLKAIGKVREIGGAEGQCMEQIRFFVHDDADVNIKSGGFLRAGLFPKALDFTCLCQFLDRVWTVRIADSVDRFESLWYSLFRNDKRRHIFREVTALEFPAKGKMKVFITYLSC